MLEHECTYRILVTGLLTSVQALNSMASNPKEKFAKKSLNYIHSIVHLGLDLGE